MDSITLQRLQHPVQVNTTSTLMLEIWSRAQTRIIQDLHLQAHRHRNHTWETVHRDTAKINLLNRLSTAIMAGILAVDQEKVDRITLNKIAQRKTQEKKRIPEEETQEENRIQLKTPGGLKITTGINLKSTLPSNQGNHQYNIRKSANVLHTSSLKKKILKSTRSNRPITRSQTQ